MRRGALDAVQVADRFHLIKNLTSVMEKVFKRHMRLVSEVPAPDSPRILSHPRPDREAMRPAFLIVADQNEDEDCRAQ